MDIFNRYDPLKRFARLLYRAKQFVETGEWNEQISITEEREKAIGDALMGAISLREGGEINVNAVTGTVRLNAAKVWAGGYVHVVPAATLLEVPMVGISVIGVSVKSVTVTDSDDPDLKGIVPDVASTGKPLAARQRFDATWGRSGDPFYPVHTIIDGVIQNERVAPSNDSAELLVERHIFETHGSHIVEGFQVTSAGFEAATKNQVLVIEAGVLRAQGRRIQRSVAQRYKRLENPTLVPVNGETHLFEAGGRITLNNGPIDSIQTLTSIKEVTETITHQLAGGRDALPQTPVYRIVKANQGAKVYSSSDFRLNADTVDWSGPGDEPSPGSTYTVTYQFIDTIDPLEVGRDYILVEPSVIGAPVQVTYRWKLPRIDILAINLSGEIVYLEGVSTRFNPVPPSVPSDLAPLARIDNLWGLPPVIVDVDQRKLTEADVRALRRDFLRLSDLVSLVVLEKDIQERDPSSRKGSFVDPFISDIQRDLGVSQDAAIVEGVLQLPIVITPMFVDIGRSAILLPFVKEAILSQPFRTFSQKINEFQSFDPLPAQFGIRPAVDRWNITNSSTISRATQSAATAYSFRPETVGTPLYGTVESVRQTLSTSTSLSSRSVSNLEFLRQISIQFEALRFGPGEELLSITFDGVDVTSTVTGTKRADPTGLIQGSFTVPANVRAGTKEVVITGKGGTRGFTSFTGQGTVTNETYVRTTNTHTVTTIIDPVAQSFILTEARQITGIRVEFTERGNPAKPVVLEMRTLEGSTPSDETVAEGITAGTFAIGDPKVAKPGNWTEIDFRFPTLVPAADWRAFALLTDDASHAIAAAQLGDQSDPTKPRGFDQRAQQWIRRNPAGGDLFKGSNNKSWLVVPDSDVTHEVIGAKFTSLSRMVSIGRFRLSDINPNGISDILVLLIVQEPTSDTRVRLQMIRQSGEVVAFEPNARLQLDEYLTEEIEIRMVLTGTEKLSPIVMPECQILWGRLKETANYVSEANVIDRSAGDVKLRTVIEVFTPGTSAVTLDHGNPGAYYRQSPVNSIALGDGWVERDHVQSPYPASESRVQITLTGTPKHRPGVRNLRSRATEV